MGIPAFASTSGSLIRPLRGGFKGGGGRRNVKEMCEIMIRGKKFQKMVDKWGLL
jgi:hypothetical protein